jgi:hypothetical protein
VLEPKRLATNVFAVILHDFNDLGFPEESENLCEALHNFSITTGKPIRLGGKV